MKISITGHTSGIGKALFDYFKQEQYRQDYNKDFINERHI
jgi:short-subunit dehydrogenase involved in D-alanine esterification of teichoic acids